MQAALQKSFFIVSLLSLLWGCSTTRNRKMHHKFQQLIIARQYDQALELAKSKQFYPDRDSRLLKLLEIATVHYLKEDYYQALKTFDMAHDLSDELFTKSIKGKLKSALVNANMDKYYGEKYERSLIRFYQALSHYMLFQRGYNEAFVRKIPYVKNGKQLVKQEKVSQQKLSYKERRQHLLAARATILEWDSLLDSYRSVSGGEAVYKDDLVAKIFGAFIHEQIGTRSDRQIALKLYRKAQEILFKNYGMYPSFNQKAAEFMKNFVKFAQLGVNKVKQKYFSATDYYQGLTKFLQLRIKKLQQGKQDNLFVFMQSDFIAPKIAKKISIPIPATMLVGYQNAKKGMSFGQFVGAVLGFSAGTMPSITFELPMVAHDVMSKHYQLVVKNSKGKEVAQQTLELLEPLSEVAYAALEYKKSVIYTKIGMRLVAKHLVALKAAYEIYKKSGMFAATIAYALSNKAIAASEKADLRYWASVAKRVSVTSLHLAPGIYQLEVHFQQGQAKHEHVIVWQQKIKIKYKTKLVDMRL